jgi:hypothetical protein
VVKTPRHRRTNRPGPRLENAAKKAKDAPSLRTRLSCVWRGLLFATTLEVVRAEQVSNRVGWGSALIESETPLWRAQNGVPARLERAKHPHGPVARPPAAPKSPTGSIRHRSCPVRGGTATADAGRGASGRALPQRQRWLPNRWPSRAEPLLEAWKRGFSHAFQEVAQSRKHREGWGGGFLVVTCGEPSGRPVGTAPASSPTNRRLMFRRHKEEGRSPTDSAM